MNARTDPTDQPGRLRSSVARAPNCPICGLSNGCVPASTGSFSQACWCTEATFGAQVLALVPADLQGKACICRNCAERLKP